MKVLVLGSSGQLGSEIRFLSKGYTELEFVFTSSSELDITGEDSLQARFREGNFDYCINCAAYTAVDKAETDVEKAYLVNAQGVKNIAQVCERYNVVLIHVSTDFVFSGEGSVPLNENAATNPVSVYGETKLKGEQVIQEQWSKHFIFRTSWLYSSFGNNFVKTMLRLAESRPEVNVVSDQYGTPTYARDLARLILIVIESKSVDYGLYHYSNEGGISWYGFAKEIFEIKGVNIQLNAIPTSEYPTPAKRPVYSVMDLNKVKSTFGIKIPTWENSLKNCLLLL